MLPFKNMDKEFFFFINSAQKRWSEPRPPELTN